MTTVAPMTEPAAQPSVTLYHGDCLDVMPKMVPATVNLLFADLPYSVTRCAWDVAIDQGRLWPAIAPLLVPAAAMVATADVRLAMTLIKHSVLPFRYDMVWHKSRVAGFLNANRAPLRAHEIILYFAAKHAPYTVQKKRSWRDRPPSTFSRKSKKSTDCYGSVGKVVAYEYGPERYPTSVLEPASPASERGLHPTQKPVALLEWLIKTYTNEGDTILDPAAGSGTTAIAALRTGRNVVCIKKDPAYFEVMRKRIAGEQARLGFEVTV